MENRRAFFIVQIMVVLILAGCKAKKDQETFGELLSQPPYDRITDSIHQDPANDELLFRRAVLLNTNNYPEPALADFQKAWSLKKDERYAFGMSNLLLDKQPDSAVLFLKQALQELPESYLLQLTLARAYSARQQYPEALALCDSLLSKKPGQSAILKMKADLLEKQGQVAAAIQVLEKAYADAPDDVELNYMLALKWAETKNSRVLALCDSLIRADSLGVHAEPYYYKGIYYASINDKPKALAFFDSCIRTDINFLDGYIEKGSLLYDMKRYQDALAVFNLCLTVSPKFADNYYWIAKCQQAMGQVEEAKANYQRAYSLDRNLVEAKQALDKLND